MKKQITEYYCDRCGKNITYSEYSGNRIVLWRERILFGIATEEVYLCNNCLKVYFDFVKFFKAKGDKND